MPILLHKTPLNNLTCVITRPQHQTHQLEQLLTAAGARCIIFPTIEIHSLTIDKDEIAAQLKTADKLIFASANAIIPGLAVGPKTSAFAIGEGTKQALAAHHLNAITPENNQFNSEGLLDHPLLQSVKDENIIIFAGSGGRTLLLETLQERGANVQKIAVYERKKPHADLSILKKERIDWIISTSKESLMNLWEMAGETYQPWLVKQRVLVISEGMRRLAEELGFIYPVLVSPNATDDTIAEKLLDQYGNNPL